MTTEQWGILALVILWPLLASVARLRRGPASRDNRASDTVEVRVPAPGRSAPILKRNRQPVRQAEDQGRAPRTPLPPALPQPDSDSPVSPAHAVQSHRMFTEPSEAQRPEQKSVHSRRNAQWVRPMRNLRRAIIVTTILTRPNA